MAYKFQLGAFTASGSLTAEGNLLAKDSALSGSSLSVGGTAVSSTAAELNLVDGSSAGTIVNSKAVIYGSSGEVNATTLQIAGTSITTTAAEINLIDGGTARGTTALADGDGILVNDAGTMRMTNVTKMGEYILPKITGGDVAVDSAGAATIQANAVEGSMLNSNAVSGAINLSGNKIGLSGSVAGNGLKFVNATNLDDPGSHTHIAKLAVQLESTNALSVSSNGVDLKGTIAGNRAFTGNVEVGGDLFVKGTTTTVNSTSVLVTGSIVFEGATANNAETTLAVIDPTADRTISLPDLSANATLAAFSDASFSNANITPSPITLTELNLLDGGTAASACTLVDADRIIVNDDGSMKQIAVSNLKTYIGNTSNLDVALKDNTESLAVGVNYLADLGAGGEAVAVPASPSVGDAVYVKAPSNCSSDRPLTIAVDTGSHSIDGEDQIVLESPHAAVMLVYVVANVWKVF